jgi:ATP-dependent helicase/nuclease subunit B
LKSNVYTVPPGRPFLRCLAAAILDGNLPVPGGKSPAPLDIAAITLMLPTRRATRALQDAFLAASGGRAMLLPKIMPVSEGQEELSLLAGVALDSHGDDALEIPPAMSELERRLTLTQLILRWAEAMRHASEQGGEGESSLAPFAGSGMSTPAQAATLAAELARLMDMVETEGVSLDGLAALVPETFSAHWQRTLDFLKIVTNAWPAHLAEKGLLSAVGRRNAVIRAEARRLSAMPPKGPVIVAGVTGSIPATVELMRAVAALPNGAIVLPALDTALDDASWDAIVPDHPEHPQFGLKTLLDGLGVRRRDVTTLPGADGSPSTGARAGFVAEAMRPSGTTERWQTYAEAARKDEERSALRGLSLVEAPTAQDEAEVVSLILRQAVETPGRTAALVSPDRLLARRVAVRLEAWGIKVDDSAGRPFAKTVPGAFLNLILDAVAKSFAPAELMALLKHPLTRLGLDPFAVRRAARALEIAAFRTPYLGEGLGGVDAALERARQEMASKTRRGRAVRRLWDEDWQGARDLVARLRAAVAALDEAYRERGERPLRDFVKAHVAAAEALAAVPAASEEETRSPLWVGEAGDAAARFFASLIDEQLPDLMISAGDYADLYRSLIAGETVRPRVPVHPRVFIWGPFEARLQQTDVVILGSMNDGTWPESADPGPWLNRPMRKVLGLPSPEEKIGQSAHDFATLLASPDVILTRAEKMDGVPTVPSRWLLRFEALLAGMGAADALMPETPWLALARRRDHAPPAPRLEIPAPRPPVAQRPRKLSVSRIETWIANPYAIFAGEILGLEPLDALGQEPGPALRGSIIHAALSQFAKEFPKELPANPKRELLRLARETLEHYAAHPRIAAFWVPRFERFAAWFAETEPARRAGVEKVVAETSGTLVLDAPGGPFALTARADRIDVKSNALVITDYKTGAPPNDAKVNAFVAPQLPLEAAIALIGADDAGFDNVPRLSVAALRYIRASGGEPAGDERDVRTADVTKLAQSALEGLQRHVARFDDPATPYSPLRRARFSYDYDAYAHLARVAEWSSGTGNGEDA